MTEIDWAAVRRRVELAGRPREPAAGELAARARALARPLPPAELPAGEALDLVVFRLGGERFAVDATRVLEALPLPAPTPVPGGHPWLRGVVAHRGGVLGVFDVAQALLPGAPACAGAAHVVAVETDGLTFGIAADGVEETRRTSAAALRPPPPGPFLGMTEDPLIVLDLEALAADPRLRIDDAE
jgi:chemotaxis signal transduction protein